MVSFKIFHPIVTQNEMRKRNEVCLYVLEHLFSPPRSRFSGIYSFPMSVYLQVQRKLQVFWPQLMRLYHPCLPIFPNKMFFNTHSNFWQFLALLRTSTYNTGTIALILVYRIVASTNTCYYSGNQVFGGVTIRVLCSKRGCY